MNQVELKRRKIELCAAVIGLINILLFGNIVGNNGIAYLTIAFASFSLLKEVLSGGVSDTLGKMLRVRNNKEQYRNALCVRKHVLVLQGGIGLACSILFAIGAGSIAQNLFRVQYCTLIMMLLAPVLFLRTVSAVLIGCFQGEGTELPAAVAAPLRQILLMGLGVLFANIMGEYGAKVSALLGDNSYTAMYGGAGIAIAVLLAEIFVLLFLGLIMLGNRRSVRMKQKEGMKQTDSPISTVKVLYGAMWIPMVLHILELLPIWVGALFYRKSILDVEVFAENLGLLFGKFFVICGIVVLLICVLVLSVNAKTIGALKKDDMRSAKGIFQSGLHIAVVNALFCSVFIAVMADLLAGMVNGAYAEAVANMFRFGSVLILFAVLFFYFSRLLLFTGKKYYLLGVTALADIIFIILVSVLLNMGKIGIMSLIYAAMAATGIGCLILGFVCCRLLHAGIEWLQTLVIPVGGASVAGLVSMFLGKLLSPHLGNFITVFVCLVIAVILYWVILLLLRSFREQELKYIPGGKLIYAVGQTLRIF